MANDPNSDPITSMNISLPVGLKAFVDSRIGGRFSSASEYVRDLIRIDQRRAAEEQLEALLLEGLQSGSPVDVTPEFWEAKRRQLMTRRDSPDAS